MKLISNSKLNIRVLPLFMIFFITFFYHMNAFLYNPRVIMFLLMGVAALLLTNANGRISRKMHYIDWLFVITLIPVLYKNNDLQKGGFDFVIMYLIMIYSFIVISKKDWWSDIVFRYILRACSVMVFFTIFFIIVPSIQAPILQTLFPTSLRMNVKGAMGLTNNYSTNGNFMALATGAIFWLIDSKKHKYWPCVILSIFCLIATLKRGPLMWCMLALIVSYYVYNSDKKATRLIKLLAIGFISFVVFSVLVKFIPQLQAMVERFIVDENSDVTFLSGREVLFEAAWKLFLQNPVTGVGWNGYPLYAASMTGFQDMQAHNVYLQLLAETGFIGFSIFMFLFIKIVLLATTTLSQYVKFVEGSEITKRRLAFSLYIIIYFIAYGMSGLVLLDITLLYLFMFSTAYVVCKSIELKM